MPDDRARYTHMLEMAQKAVGFVQGRARPDLDSVDMLALALMRCVEIIGEAASNISEEGLKRAPEIDWKVVTGMRHRLIHAYHEVNLRHSLGHDSDRSSAADRVIAASAARVEVTPHGRSRYREDATGQRVARTFDEHERTNIGHMGG